MNEEALLLSFENIIDETINDRVIALHHLFAQNNFPGFIETVPAYASLAVFYDAAVIKKTYPKTATAFDFVKLVTETLLKKLENTAPLAQRPTTTIPVYYNGEDLALIAELHQLSMEDVINIHISKIYRVYMVGFLPGFTYLGSVDERIAVARRPVPRIRVPAGSVGIAGFQTGIYPMDSPGGWQLIGQTPTRIFNKEKSNPCKLQAGDRVQFTSISKTMFEDLYEY